MKKLYLTSRYGKVNGKNSKTIRQVPYILTYPQKKSKQDDPSVSLHALVPKPTAGDPGAREHYSSKVEAPSLSTPLALSLSCIVAAFQPLPMLVSLHLPGLLSQPRRRC